MKLFHSILLILFSLIIGIIVGYSFGSTQNKCDLKFTKAYKSCTHAQNIEMCRKGMYDIYKRCKKKL